MNQFIYYSPYFFQFIFLYLFINQNKTLINFFNIEIGRRKFEIIGLITYFIILLTKFSYSYYTNNLLLFYIIQTLVYYNFLSFNFNVKDSICLSLLFSFATSFYWEIPIHIIVLFNGEPLINLLIQSMHFITLPFILKRLIIINKNRFYKYCLYGLIINDVISIILFLFIKSYQDYFSIIMRIISCVTIIYAVILNIKRE